ncbi:hypothetical protein C6P46_001058 [Rhodotorula mucilaginosa]|uniref:Uncharacterized protein n=1 Tax=Rhodotorula mucilaginosa TaxID=5537 RepID=A0A9P7B2Q6_RHOMI|nr:hypothetical protein C6P46_001058 [Rhodotorula mucilaginosa]
MSEGSTSPIFRRQLKGVAAHCLIVLVTFGLELYLIASHALLTVIKLVSSAETGLEDYSDLSLAEQEKEAWRKERAALRAEIARLRGKDADSDLVNLR